MLNFSFIVFVFSVFLVVGVIIAFMISAEVSCIKDFVEFVENDDENVKRHKKR